MKREVIRNNELDYDDDANVDFELMSHTQLVGPNVGLIPLQNAVQPTRVFYGARFANQAQPVVNNEAPLVQALDEGDTSYDEKLGVKAGAIRAKSDGIIEDVTDDLIRLRRADGQSEDIPLFKHYPFNRYSGLTQKSVVQKGQQVRASDTLARSNFTDDKGALALGLNARIGLVPYKGFSMDDAIVVSEDFAKRATSQHMDMLVTELGKNGVQGGRDHFVSLFPDEFTRDQLDKLDEHGLIKPGTMLSKGDPLVLATRPRNMNSSQAQAIGRLSRQARSLRANASNIWEQESPGVVTDVVRKNDGTVKVLVEYAKPLELGDKLALRSGNKNIVSKIIPSAQMPRTADGQPLEVLLNHQGIPSRANPSLVLELLLGKVAAKTGKPIKLPAFNKADESWVDFARQKLAELKLTDKEDVFDPTSGRKLVKPITVGNGYILKLHHVASHKLSARGQAGYDQDGLPMKGGQAGGGAKRRSGLEVAGMLSSGAYANLRENMTLSGTQCFDDHTEVLTKDGWKLWSEVDKSDLLYTRSADDSNSAWFELPSRLVTYQYEGDLMGFENKHLDWLVTPNHRFWGLPCVVSRSKSWYRHRFFTAADVHGKSGIVAAFGAVYAGTVDDTHTVRIPRHSKGRSADLSISLRDYCQLMGWWLSEGCAGIDKKDGTGRVIISQSHKVNPVKFAEIRELLCRLGFHKPVMVKESRKSVNTSKFKCTRDRTGEIVGLRVCHRGLAEHLLQFGNRSWNKKVPSLLFQVSQTMRLEFLRCFTLGDGCARGSNGSNHYYVSTSSPWLRDDLQRLAVLSGMAAFTGVCRGDYARPHYRVIYSGNTTDLSVTKKTSAKYKGHYRQAYSGKVYCATMRTGLLFVRRNGKCMWSGNSDQFWRDLRAGNSPKPPGAPFVWTKFRALLQGSGVSTRDLGDGRLRLAMFTDKDLEDNKPLPIANGELVDFSTLVPKKGGLFDESLVAGNRWGYIDLPEPMPQPAAEDTIRRLLGLTKKEFEQIIAGETLSPQ